MDLGTTHFLLIFFLTLLLYLFFKGSTILVGMAILSIEFIETDDGNYREGGRKKGLRIAAEEGKE